MEFVVTETFLSIYEAADDNEASVIDETILQLLTNHASGWARRGRIVGASGGSWIVRFMVRGRDASIYWDYYDDEVIVLLGLVMR